MGAEDLRQQDRSRFRDSSSLQVGSAASILGTASFGARLSVIDCVALSSGLSLRSLARFGDNLAVFSASRCAKREVEGP